MKKMTSRELLRIAHANTRWLLTIVIFSAVIGSGIGVGTPLITQYLLDDYIPNKNLSLIITMIVSLVVLLVLKVLSTYLITYFGGLLRNRVEYRLREHVFKHFEHLKVGYIDTKNEGHFLTRINDDSFNVSQIIRYVPENLVSGLIFATSAFTFVFMFNIFLGLILLFIFLFLVLFPMALESRFMKAWLKVKKVSEGVNMSLVNSIAGVKESKIYSAENREVAKFSMSLQRLRKVWRGNIQLYAQWMALNALVIGSISVTMLGFGSWRVVEGDLLIGELVAAVLYGGQIVDPINKFLAVFDIIITARSSVKRLVDFLNVPQEDYASGINFKKAVRGAIEFQNVSFKYSSEYTKSLDDEEADETKAEIKENKHIIQNLNFKISAGEKVAFVGETGSGKSTILKLILRFYDPTGGSVLIDEQDISLIKLSELRKNVGYLQQDPYLFYDTIRNNVAFSLGTEAKNELENDKLVESALDASKASDFVNTLPNKSGQNVGPRGISLSGGQKQRLAIARTLLKDAPIIMFDEATSALDNETEKEIQTQIEAMIKDKTAIFIAHRLSSIKNLDRIFVLKHGEIIESGSHAELMKRRGYYYKLNKIIE